MAWNRFVGTLIDQVDVSEGIFRAVFAISEDLPGHRYEPSPVADESVGLYFAHGGALLDTRASTAPGAHGGWETLDDPRSMGRRNLTVRSYDPDTAQMCIDVARHARGVVIDWFYEARPGWQVLMAGPRSWHTPPTALKGHHLLVADLAGLPALARILEGTPDDLDVTAVVEVLTSDDLDYLPHHPRLRVHALIGSGNGSTESRLFDEVMQLPDLDRSSYYWVAAETSHARRITKHLRSLGVDKSACVSLGYWTDTTHWSW